MMVSRWFLVSALLLLARGGSAPPTDPAAAISDGATLKARSKQKGLRLSVDGVDRGPLPAELHDLQAGEHKLAFGDGERYAHTEKSIVVKGKEAIDLGTIALKVLRGNITFRLGTPGAQVFLSCECGGKNARKVIPMFPLKIDFSDPDEHWVITAMKAGYEDPYLPVSFDDGVAEKQLTITLPVKPMSP